MNLLQGPLPSPSIPLSKPRLACHAHISRKALIKVKRQWRSPATSENGPQLQEEILRKSVNESLNPIQPGEDLQGSQQGGTMLRPGGVLPPGSVVGGNGRFYTIEEVLGTGSNAVTYRATVPDGRKVAVKSLSFRSLKDWKQLDLFQREARTLASLDHPGIPKYIDYFEQDNELDRCFCIVQEEAVGASLGNMISEGMRCTDAEATRIGIELLRILSYLSSLRPPVVHRDVKPENIILEGGRWGGRVYLVDFGGVQGAAMSATEPSSLGSTIIGTYGYMAPEQFRGAAQPASDVYAAGATLLFLLSGRPPSAFPQERMRIRWRGSPDAPGLQPPSPRWATVLDGLLEPLAEDRLSATEALDILEGRTEVDRQQTDERTPESSREQRAPRTGRSTFQRKKSLARRPAGTRVELERTPSRLDIVIPPKGLMNTETMATGSFALAWNAFVGFWTISALAGGGILFALFSAPFWFAGAQLARQAFGGALVKERIAIGQQKFRIGQELAVFRDGSVDFLGARNTRVVEGLTSDIQGARIITSVIVNGVPQTVIEVLEGIRKHRFGEGLELMEQQWLVQEINSHVEALGSTVDVDSLPPPEAPAVFNDDPEAAN